MAQSRSRSSTSLTAGRSRCSSSSGLVAELDAERVKVGDGVEVAGWPECMVGEQVEQEAERVCPREVDAVRRKDGLEQLLSSLLAMEAHDLVRDSVGGLEHTDSREVGVRTSQEGRGRARSQVDS
jgi:hypothetical protein